MAKLKFQSLPGMYDILPEEQKYFQKIYKVVENTANSYNFQKIETPILEPAELFSKGVGLTTDIVRKEMYSFKTKGGDFVTLRPEGTASVVRTFIEKGMRSLPQPVKLWYFGPFFRHERQQLGRYRQFHQFGFEVLGEYSPIIDAQIIKICYSILKKLGLKNFSLEINSIGCKKCRSCFKKELQVFLKRKKAGLCKNCQKRLKENPLRILDCKEEKCQRIISKAPQTVDYLCEECHNHFKEVLEFLDELGLPYKLNTHLVRGLDYYTKTVFEIINSNEKIKKIGTLIGGGRYDNLVKLLGRKDIPACGASGGIERIIDLMKFENIKIPKTSEKKVFLVQLGNLAKKRSLKLFEELRESKIKTIENFSKNSLNAQLKIADRLKIRHVLIFGQKEALENNILIRDMEKGTQKQIKLKNIVREIKKHFKKDK